ncbi:MAG: Hsp33 family molecular chaperone HslO [Akkermansia sp.]|nr:Hsp33 family molecular chaperone HslO [Akkermansia sp.]
MPEETPQHVEEFATVQSIFVRHRNCLLLRADMSPLFVDYYLNLMQHGHRNAETEDSVFKDLLAFFTLHLVSRPWQEYHAWTLNARTPSLANYFVSGSSLTEDVIGRVFTEGVKEPERNMLYAQNLRTGKEPQTSVIVLPDGAVSSWVEEFYRQSEQREARAFDLGQDVYALVAAQPGADYDWLTELTPDQVARIAETEETKVLETRKFTFRCGCTLQKILPTIQAMQKDFDDLLAEQGYLEASCPRCGAVYKITPDML